MRVQLKILLAISVAVQLAEAIADCEAEPSPQQQVAGPSNYGTEFFIAIPDGIGLTIQSRLTIGTPSPDGTAEYTVNATGILQTGNVTYSNPALVTLNYYLFAVADSDFENRDKGVHIKAEGAPIFVVVVINNMYFGLASFLALPRLDYQEVSYTYYVISTTSQSALKSQALLVASDDDTEVTITPTWVITLPLDAQDPASDIVAIEVGDNHTVTLHQRQTLLLYSSAALADLTGTKIVSNKPLTVISGHQCGNVPETTGFCEQLAVQIPPTVAWGNEFLLAPFAGRTTGQYHKLVAAEDNTEFLLKCGSADAVFNPPLPAGGVQVFVTSSSSFCYLRASKPVFVVQKATGGDTATMGDGFGDPVISIVSPTHQYVNRANFIAIEYLDIGSHFISTTVRVEHFSSEDILLDGLPMQCNWTEIRNTDDCAVGYGCTANISNGRHTISHSQNDGLLSTVVYGFETTPLAGYAFIAGMELSVLSESEPETEIETLPFFTLDGIPELRELEREEDAASEPINIPNGFLFGDQYVSIAYVNENGVISFNNPWAFSNPDLFPTDYRATYEGTVVAPFWSDNDIRRNGSVRYIVLTEERSTEGDEVFEQVTAFVRAQLEAAGEEQDEIFGFQGSWMLVAQWDHVHPHPHGAEDHEGVPEEFLEMTNTYQAVIVTDEVDTYALLTYTCGDIQWSTVGDSAAVVGINARGVYFENYLGSGFDVIGSAVSCAEVTSMNPMKRQANRRNTIIRSVPGGNIQKEECRTQRSTDIAIFGNQDSISELSSRAQPCPPDLQQVQTDQRFVKMSDQLQELSVCYVQALLLPYTYTSNLGATMDLEYGRVCCYADSGALYTDENDLRSGRLWVPQMDVTFYEKCCVGIDDMSCRNYRERRPVDSGYKDSYEAPDPAYGKGDPHYLDLDGSRFDYHANGEYLLLEVGSFQVQGVLRVVVRPDGAMPAVHTSFAFGEPGQYSYQMVIPGSDIFAIYQTQQDGIMNTIEITDNLTTDGDVYLDENMKVRITRRSGQRIRVLTQTGTYFDLGWFYWSYTDVWYGCVDVWVPKPLVDGTRGLIGTAVPIESDNDWELEASASMFVHTAPVGRKKRELPMPNKYWKQAELTKRQTDSQMNFTFPVGQRFSIDDLQIEFTDEQREICRNITECLFDLVVSDDVAVAMQTMEDIVEVQENEKSLNTFPPNITGDGTFRVTVGQEAIYNFTVVDGEYSFTVEVVGGLPVGAALEDRGGGMYYFIWNLASVEDVQSAEFLACNTEGACSMLMPQLEVCACMNEGNCSLDGVLNTTTPVVLLNCFCPDAYSGEFCDEDRDGCSEIQCFGGVGCLDVPAPDSGAVCGPCPNGYTGNGEKCTDLDECALNSTLCEQICVNTVGSYACTCEDGYQLLEISCRDINECEGVNDCQQICINTEGSFVCSCQAGFTLDADEVSCTADEPCSDDGGCSDICAFIDGRTQCSCHTGFRLDRTDNRTCIDVDECERFSPCDQTCTNTHGSYECGCTDGYILQADMRTCEDIDECVEAILNQTDLCPANSHCSNTPGSYECPCVPGHHLFNGTCISSDVSMDCSCSRKVTCSFTGAYTGATRENMAVITGDVLKCTVSFDREILARIMEHTFLDTSFNGEFLSSGSFLFLQQLRPTISRFGIICEVNQDMFILGDPTTTLQSMGIETLDIVYLDEGGEYSTVSVGTPLVQELIVDGDPAFTGTLGAANVCSLQHLLYTLSTSGVPRASCTNSDNDVSTEVTFDVLC